LCLPAPSLWWLIRSSYPCPLAYLCS
jgi:hypothetical protein